MTYSLLESRQADALLLLALHGIIEENTSLENVQLPLREEGDAWKESTAGVLEGVGKEKSEDKATGNGEDAHDGEQPEPAGSPVNTTHVENSVCQQL